MNRHQSNPFLAGWEEDDSSAGYNTIPTNDSSTSYTNPKSADRRLYKRNMSSFEAASLQLEQQQLRDTESNDLVNQTDLIAKMTANFQTAIETSDKQFETDYIGEHITFDPFETIIDDDVSLPSPAIFSSQTNNAQSDCVIEHEQANTGSSKTKNTHDSIDNDDEELVSTPVRNIKSLSSKINNVIDVQKESQKLETAPISETVRESPAKVDQDESTNSIEKASIFASLMASAESSGLSNSPDGPIQKSCGQSELIDGGIEPAAHIIKGSPSSRDGNIDRPVGFFDPFETVIDKDALTSLMNDYNSTDQASSQQHEIDDNNDSLLNESSQINSLPKEEQITGPPLHPIGGREGTDTGSVETVTGSAAEAPGYQMENTERIKKVEERSPPALNDSFNPKSYSCPKKVVKNKPSFQEDSSDSSKDDDRIQIVIRTKAKADQQNAGTPHVVPLLPPPPSKSSMKQARERGQVEDMPSPVMGYKNRNETEAQSHAYRVDNFQHHEDLSATQGSETSKGISRKMSGSDSESISDGQDQEDKFVIKMTRSGEEEDNYAKPETPLYDEDTSYVLEEFPAKCESLGWDMMLRYPPKKKLTSNRFWKKIHVKLAQVPIAPDCKTKPQSTTSESTNTCLALQIFDKPDDKKPMQEIPIQATYTISDISSQQLDQFGKIFTIKLQYIFYKERVGIRQGQISRFIHTGHIGTSTTSGGHGVDPISIGAIKRAGAPIEHSPQISQIIKLGCTDYEDIKQFKNCLEDHLFKMSIHRDRALSTYKTEEVQMAVRDETYIELNQIGTIIKQLARVRLFFLSFLNGTPTIEVGINAIERQGREIVGRMDILPVDTEEWIRLEAWELHSTVARNIFDDPESRLISLVPPDATFFELMRFRVRPPRCRELPLQISADMSVTRTKVVFNCEVMVPGCVSRKHGQIPCENIAIRVFIPECWIYFFREEKHFRMGSKKSVNRRPGKVKGIERFLGGGGLQDINDESSLIEVTSGQAKYEHHHHSIVWRAARWPKESQSAYVQNSMKIRLPLTAYDKMPENFYEYVHVEYTMPATTVSHTTLRSISVNPCDEDPPEKYVKYSAKYEYKVRMRQFINLGSKPGETQVEASPIVIMKQPDLHGDLQREEDSDDLISDEEHVPGD